MHSSHLNVLQTRVEDLTAEEQRLLGLLSDVRAKLAKTKDEQRRVKFAAKSAGRGNGVPLAEWRRKMRELGTFTASELAAEMDVTQATAKRHIDASLVNKPPLVKAAGRVMGKALYEHIKSDDPGEAFKAQRRLQPVPDLDTVIGVGSSAPARGTVMGVSRTGGAGMIADKVVRAEVQRAIDRGWELRKKGDGHFVLCKGAKRVPVTGTPTNPHGSADIVRRMTREPVAS